MHAGILILISRPHDQGTDIVDLVTFLRNKYMTVEGVKIGSGI